MTQDSVKMLETLLLSEKVEGLEPTVIRANRLGAYAYSKAEGKLKTLYKGDYLAAATRHQLVKTQLLPLIRAWRKVDIEILLFKGFYLAEFVYQTAAERFYGDVDILIHPENTNRAKAVAESLGWQVTWQRVGARRRQHVHEELHLVSEDGQLALDIHRFPIHSSNPYHKRQQNITRSVWQRALDLPWEGTTIKVMSPVDALLVGLILNRSWSEWGVKPHDLLDMRALITLHRVTRRQLEVRGAELNCQKTLTLFLSNCDPWENKLRLFQMAFWQRQWHTLAILKDGRYLGWERFTFKTKHRIKLLRYVLQVSPEVLRVRRHLNETQDLRHLLEKMDRLSGLWFLDSIPRDWLPLAVKWASKFAMPRLKGTCVLRSLVLYRAARQYGESPIFYSGVRRVRQCLEGHAWVELKGRPLDELGDAGVRHLYRVNFRYPSKT